MELKWLVSGFVHHEPKKIPGLFQDFLGPFSHFPGQKITNRQQIFIATTCSELSLALWLKENRPDKFYKEISEFALTNLTIFNISSDKKLECIYFIKKCSQVQISRTFRDLHQNSRTFQAWKMIF